MKRSRHIRLVLIGSLTAGAATGCGDARNRSGTGTGAGPVSTSNVYTNDHHVPGAGYYHAPFRAWYPEPLNRFDPATGRYFQGGQWLDSPHTSITNLSSPTEEAARLAQASRTDQPPTTRRGGFGGTSFHRSGFLS